MPLKIPSHQLGNESNSSIQKQLTSQGFGLTWKPLLRDSGQAEESGCPGLAGLGKEPAVAAWVPPGWAAILCSAPRDREGWCEAKPGREQSVGTHPRSSISGQIPGSG